MNIISVSDIVESQQGRDKNKIFVVISVKEGFVFVADGKNRRMESPKRKKQKHLALIQRSESPVAQKLKSGQMTADCEIRRELAAYRAAREINRGGN
jgi:hypothetical protein